MKIYKYNIYSNKNICEYSLQRVLNWELDSMLCSANLGNQKRLNKALVELMLIFAANIESDDKISAANRIINWVNDNTSGDFKFRIEE